MILKCSNCNAAIAEGDKFCGECGKPVEQAPATETMSSPESVQVAAKSAAHGVGQDNPNALLPTFAILMLSLICADQFWSSEIVYDIFADTLVFNGRFSSEIVTLLVAASAALILRTLASNLLKFQNLSHTIYFVAIAGMGGFLFAVIYPGLWPRILYLNPDLLAGRLADVVTIAIGCTILLFVFRKFFAR